MSKNPFHTPFRVQAKYFLSEKTEARGSVPVGTLTRGEGFAAKKGRFGAGRGV